MNSPAVSNPVAPRFARTNGNELTSMTSMRLDTRPGRPKPCPGNARCRDSARARFLSLRATLLHKFEASTTLRKAFNLITREHIAHTDNRFDGLAHRITKRVLPRAALNITLEMLFPQNCDRVRDAMRMVVEPQSRPPPLSECVAFSQSS